MSTCFIWKITIDRDARVRRKIYERQQGNIAIILCICLPVLCALAGASIDFIRYANNRSELRTVADASALAGARKFTLAGANEAQIKSFVLSEIEHMMSSGDGATGYQSNVVVSPDTKTVTTTISQSTVRSFFGQVLPDHISITSEAVARGQVKLCALALNQSMTESMSLKGDAVLEANECSIFSNSSSATGLFADMNASVTADLVCSSGGYAGSPENFSVEPLVDCPAYQDPLAGNITPPSVGGCDATDEQVGNVTIETKTFGTLNLRTLGFTEFTLEPGVYCGGIEVFELADLTFEPGVYIIKDGPLKISWRSTVKGEGVAFYFTGDDAVLDFGTNASLDLTAPETGSMAGVLFMDDPENFSQREHIVRSADARNLLGTFYFPNATFKVETNQPVADQSAYTIIVADQIKLAGQPSLFLNSNYEATDVPVPQGVGPIGGTTYLRK